MELPHLKSSTDGQKNKHSYFSPYRRVISQRPFRDSLGLLIILSLVLAFILVPVELSHPDAQIQTIGDSLWFVVSSITGVGYGDLVPVTQLGRVIGSILQIGGLIMFGLMIGIIGITMTRKQEEYNWNRLFSRIDLLSDRLEQIEDRAEYLIKKEKK